MAKRRPQGDGTIRKRSDGRWEARIIVGHKNDGSPMYKSAFAKTQKSALKQLHQLIDLYRDVDLTEDSRMTLGEWLDKWLDEYMIFTIRESTLDSYYEFFLLELTTGMRRGEILGLQWKDVNFATGELHIRRQVVKKGAQTQITKPKTTSSIRTLILPHDMLDILAVHKKTATCEWVFPSPVKEGEPRNPDSIYGKFQKILKRAGCKKIRFHDLRHTFATMALENGMDIKTLSAMIGHISAETTLNIYSHITDTMQQQAAVRIDREIGGTNAEMPEFTQSVEPPKASEPAPTKATPEKEFEPYKGKIRKSGTGCVTMINDHLYEGRFTPRVNGKRISKNVYAKTREECEEKLAELIKTMKAEIAEMKKVAKNA